MDEDEIRKIVRLAVMDTLREVIRGDLREQPFYLWREQHAYISELGEQVNRFGSMLSLFEKKFTGPTQCFYDKQVVDAIKSDTSKL
jgi:hypothetical protein